MTAMILFTTFCIGGVVFLLSFFFALCREGRRSHYAVNLQHQGNTGVPSVGEIANDRATTRAA